MNKSNLIQFLHCYETHSCLWDPRQENYRNSTVRLAALKSIIQEMGVKVTVIELKTKIKNIRTTYIREISKIIESKKNGATGDDVYKPQLIWFPTADRFLNPVIKRNLNSSQPDDDIETSSCSQELKEESPLEPEIKEIKKYTPKKKKKREQQNDPPVSEPLNHLELPQNTVRNDEFDTFGQHVANQLRSLPLQNAIMCQIYINNYLSQERITFLNSGNIPISKVVSSNSEYSNTVDPLNPAPSWSTMKTEEEDDSEDSI